MLTDVGPVEVKVPRDTAGSFEPQIVKKRQRRLTGVDEMVLPEAVETVWPRTIVQTCVVHLLRNSFRYAARQDWDKVAKALKPVYTAPSEDAATERFLEFQESWGRKYPAIVKLWSDAWAEFVPFLSFEVEIRKVICSTNAIESVNARIRKRWTMRWKAPLNAFQIAFEGRLTPSHN